jgi:hypothetical protein
VEVDRVALAELTGGGGDCLCPDCLPLAARAGQAPLAAPGGEAPVAAPGGEAPLAAPAPVVPPAGA